MSGVVSYDLFTSRFGSNSTGITSEGGFYETFINKTGADSVKGTIVVANTANEVDNAVSIAPANSSFPIGVIYEDGIADGSNVKVVVYGKAQVLLKDTVASTRGWWCGVSDVAGRMYQSQTVPSATEHTYEIGHSLEYKAAGVAGSNVLALVQIHFN